MAKVNLNTEYIAESESQLYMPGVKIPDNNPENEKMFEMEYGEEEFKQEEQ